MFFYPRINYQDTTFYLGHKTIPKTSSYTCLGIPFRNDLEP